MGLGLKLAGPPVFSDISAPTGKTREIEAISFLWGLHPRPNCVGIW
jgi:hypothetical protein